MKLVYLSKEPKGATLEQLIALARRLGVDGFDLCVRPDYVVTPQRARTDLPRVVEQLRRADLEVPMITTPPDFVDPANPAAEDLIAAAGEARVGLLKLGYFNYNSEAGYWEQVAELRQRLERFGELGARHRVRICYHTHVGYMGHSAAALMQLFEGQDRQWLGAYLDTAHLKLAGDNWRAALDMVGPFLAVIGLKDVSMQVVEGRPTGKNTFPPAPQGLVDWAGIFAELQRHGYDGPLSVHAEFKKLFGSQEAFLEAVREQTAYFRAVWTGGGPK